MTDTSQIPYLLELLDDDSPVVQEAVTRELSALGDSLEPVVSQFTDSLNTRQQEALREIINANRRDWLRKAWPTRQNVEGDKEQLERALSLLAGFLHGPHHPRKLTPILDQLAADYMDLYDRPDPIVLTRFLFVDIGLHGAEADFHQPRNSNLAWVIDNKRGIPISLSCIYILVGRRLGLKIEGCNYPGHFLARFTLDRKIHVVDCYNRGRVYDIDHAPGMTPEISPSIRRMIRMPTTADTIVRRFLRNLAKAYEKIGDEENQRFMGDMLKMMPTA